MTAAVVLLSVSVAALTWAGKEILRRVRRLEVAVADLRRELVLALPPSPPGDGPYRSTPFPPPTSIPGTGVVRSERIASSMHEDGIPRPLGPKWGLG